MLWAVDLPADNEEDFVLDLAKGLVAAALAECRLCRCVETTWLLLFVAGCALPDCVLEGTLAAGFAARQDNAKPANSRLATRVLFDIGTLNLFPSNQPEPSAKQPRKYP